MTRFINIGNCGNTDGEKWMHAFAVEPGSGIDRAVLCKIPPDTGPNRVSASVGTKASRGGFATRLWIASRTQGLRTSLNRAEIKGDPDKTIYVRNLSWKADEGAIAQYFSECGELVDVRLAMKPGVNPCGFCHISFATSEGVQAALERNQASFFGRDITVEMSTGKPKSEGLLRASHLVDAGSACRTKPIYTWW